MSRKLINAIETMKKLIGEEEALQQKFNEVAEQVINKHKNNVEVHLPIGHFQLITVNIGELHCGEHYQIDTRRKVDADGQEWYSKEAYAEHIRDYADKKYKAYKIYKEEDVFFIKNDEGETLFDAYETEADAHQEIPFLKEAYVQEKIDEYEDLEEVYDEIHRKCIYQYNGQVNVDLAKELGLGVLTMSSGEHKHQQFVYLSGCGADLTPKLIAYKALNYGYIDESDVHKLATDSRRDYFKSVVGSDIYTRMLDALEITDVIRNR